MLWTVTIVAKFYANVMNIYSNDTNFIQNVLNSKGYFQKITFSSLIPFVRNWNTISSICTLIRRLAKPNPPPPNRSFRLLHGPPYPSLHGFESLDRNLPWHSRHCLRQKRKNHSFNFHYLRIVPCGHRASNTRRWQLAQVVPGFRTKAWESYVGWEAFFCYGCRGYDFSIDMA